MGLVTFGVGTWREIMEMDFENALRTFEIHYINRINELEAIKLAEKKSKLNKTML